MNITTHSPNGCCCFSIAFAAMNACGIDVGQEGVFSIAFAAMNGP